MERLTLTLILMLTSFSFAQYGGILAGIEFSKPIFSDFSDAKPGFMLGFYHNGIIERNELNYQIEVTFNNYRDYLTNEYFSGIYSLTEEESSSYLTIEASALFEVREIFAKHFPNFLIGFSVGYCVEEDHSSKITGDVNEISPIITDSEKSPLPIIFGINTGLSYDLNAFILSLRYKLSNIILDDRDNFIQDFFLIINLKL
jgi:hypothetical protein